MNARLMRTGRRWSLYSVLLTALAYSALTLTSEPAYASTCCQQGAEMADSWCVQVWGSHVTFFWCDDQGYYFECANGWIMGLGCE